MKTAEVPPEVAEVLSRATLVGDRVDLPPALDRALYVKVDKVLRDLGGRWDRRAGGHVFASQAEASNTLRAAAAGTYASKRANSYFPSPPAVVSEVIGYAEVAPGHLVLEPSAGDGAIAVEAARWTGDPLLVHVVEIMPELRDKLSGEGLYLLPEPDFLKIEPEPRYDRVVMNPPFDRGADTAHVLHAYRFLRPGGRLVSVTTPGWTFRAYRRDVELAALVAERGHSIPLPEGSFLPATGVRTRLVILEGPEE